MYVHKKETAHGNSSTEFKKRIINSVLWSVGMYASETRSVTQADRKRLEAMEMWIWRRIEKISWVDKISNEEVLQRINETKSKLDTARKCKRVVRACAKTRIIMA